MKVICLSTLDKFSRFYLDIKRELQTKSNAQLNIYSIYFSGFLYTLLRLHHSTWISLKAWFLVKRKKSFYSDIICHHKTYKGLKFDNYIQFHMGLNRPISKNILQLQALAYIDVFDTIFNREQPDYLITIGDSRLCIEIAIALAKKKNITVYYIEQGPFSTTFFDNKGVNANLSIRKNPKKIEDNSVSKFDIDLKTRSKKYSRSPFYRGMDMVLMTLFEATKLYPPDLKYTDLNSYRPKRAATKTAALNGREKIILLVLQVPLDVNMINHSPVFKSHMDIIKSVHSSLPMDTELIVREHPLYINKYETELYDYILKHKITTDHTTPLTKAISLARVVIVNNSTVGIEAILNYKTTVVLGNAFYDNEAICLKLKHKEDLKMILIQALEHTPNTSEINNFKNLLYTTILLEGSISDKNLKSSKTIANHLIANH